MDELISKLSDLLLSSGFDNPWGDPSDNEDRTMQALHDAILEALFSGGVLPPDVLDQLFGDPADSDQEQLRQQLQELIAEIIERMKEVRLHHAVAISRRNSSARACTAAWVRPTSDHRSK